MNLLESLFGLKLSKKKKKIGNAFHNRAKKKKKIDLELELQMCNFIGTTSRVRNKHLIYLAEICKIMHWTDALYINEFRLSIELLFIITSENIQYG